MPLRRAQGGLSRQPAGRRRYRRHCNKVVSGPTGWGPVESHSARAELGTWGYPTRWCLHPADSCSMLLRKIVGL
jgi:hypothetical protein